MLACLRVIERVMLHTKKGKISLAAIRVIVVYVGKLAKLFG
jgi:hypothetical protein